MEHSLKTSRRTLLGAALFGCMAPPLASATEKAPTGPSVKFTFNGHSFLTRLNDTPSALDFASLLPLDIMIEDYSTNEKIAHLPRKLTETGSGPFKNEAPGDLCYYAPWGNLAFFYAGYRYSSGLIRLGRLEGAIDPLLTRGKFPLRIERGT